MSYNRDRKKEREDKTMLSIIALIIATIALVISTVTLIEMLPYSDNETICNLQMAIERTIDKLFEMK